MLASESISLIIRRVPFQMKYCSLVQILDEKAKRVKSYIILLQAPARTKS